jgi:hypothetical protein
LSPSAFQTLKQVRAYYKGVAKLVGVALAAAKTIQFPPDSAADARAVMRALARMQAVAIEGSGVKSWAAAGSVASENERAGCALAAASNLLRSDLNLPPVPGG